MISGNAVNVPLTLAFAVVAWRLELVGRRAFAACSPPGWVCPVLRNDLGTVITVCFFAIESKDR
jgi:hypothetical protein